MMSFLCLYSETSAAGRLPLSFCWPGFGPKPIPKQTPREGNRMAMIGPNKCFGVEWVLGQEVIGAILNLQFQLAPHPPLP